ncbi:MAG: GGDEF domain-containing protein [Clostridia bacterium]|nr:GGDEF domain-containing protein [Clostridia bacterium]
MTLTTLISIISIHFYSLTILTLITINLRKCVEMDNHLLRMLYHLVQVTMVAISADLLSWVLDGRSGNLMRFFVFATNIMYYFFVPLTAILSYMIVVYMTEHEKMFSHGRLAYCITAYAAVVLIAATDPLTGFAFTVDAANRYHRGQLFLVMFLLIFSLMLLTVIHIYSHRSEHLFDLLAAQLFWLPPVVGAVGQILIPGANLMLAGVTIAILLLYIGLQTKSNRLDYLTGVHNRRYLDDFINFKVRQNAFSAIIMDIDHYKLINDNYGHHIGDEVLITVASILKVSTRQYDCVARYGGDEFVIVINSHDRDVLYTVISRINYQIFQLNNSSGYPFILSLSMGYDVFNAESYKTGKDFVKHIDALMYANKQKKPRQLELKTKLDDTIRHNEPTH